MSKCPEEAPKLSGGSKPDTPRGGKGQLGKRSQARNMGGCSWLAPGDLEAAAA